jgi:hypothetical protein
MSDVLREEPALYVDTLRQAIQEESGSRPSGR